MSSILTNNSAMVALQTLKGINSGLEKTQSMISTGKEVGSAKDNAAVWAISKVMEADVTGFKAISDSLALGESTVALARDASETVTDLLKDIKEKIVGSQEENVDRAKIQTDIEFLTDQIESVVGAAQFNGLNLLSNKSNTEGSGTVNVLSSLDRSSNGDVTSASIGVSKQDLGIEAHTLGGTAVGAADDLVAVSAASIAAATSQTVTFTAGGAVAGASYQVSLTGAADHDLGTTQIDFEYVARDGDSELDVSEKIFNDMSAYISARELTGVSVARDATTGAITVTNNDTDAADTIALARAETLDGTAGGGLNDLSELDVTTDVGAAEAMAKIEHLIQNSIDSAAAFGSSQNRIEIQSNFVGKLMDSMESGIGSLVDADMEETSARLQALQVQQQLGIQALSIANQQPQSILSLFR
ncbi:MAG: flagellin [Pseudomonadota bacterium]